MSYGKTTSQTIKHEMKMKFPAVTICNSNAVMKNKVLKNNELNAMVYGAKVMKNKVLGNEELNAMVYGATSASADSEQAGSNDGTTKFNPVVGIH